MRVGTICLLLVTATFLFGATQEDPAIEAELNLSAGRTLGLGMQLDFPIGGLLAGRYWISDVWGGEAVLFLWGSSGDLEGMVTGRILYRVADRPVVDFYTAFGVTQPIEPSDGEPLIFSLAGGIEFGLRFASALAWNIEFGMAYGLDGELSMLFGTGIHFYF